MSLNSCLIVNLVTNWEINDKVGQSKYCASSPVQGRDTKGENPNF